MMQHAARLPLGRGAALAVLAGGLALPPAARAGTDELDRSAPVPACEAAAAARWRGQTGPHLAAMPLAPRPDRGVPFVDQVHGSCLLRVADAARSDHARRQSFNADESRLLLLGTDGRWHLYDARTLAHRALLPPIGADAEPQWHARRPELLHYLPKGGASLQLLELDVQAGRIRVAGDFATRVRQLWPTAHAVSSGGAGSPSAEGRYWVFMVDDAARGGLGMFTWDLQEDRIIAHLDFAAQRRGRPQQVAMSPSGRHVVATWADGATAYTRELGQPRRLAGRSAHGEVALTADGEDVYVALDPDGSGSPLFMVRLASGERTDLLLTRPNGRSTALELSGRATRRPGWVLVATHADQGKGARQWLHRRLMAVELKPAPRIVHLAFHRHAGGRQGGSPQASVNRDFTRVLFTSGWGEADGTRLDTYLLLLPRSGLHR